MIELKFSKATQLRLVDPSTNQMIQLGEISKELIHLKKVEIKVIKVDAFQELCDALLDMPEIKHLDFELCPSSNFKPHEVLQNMDSHPKLKSLLKGIWYPWENPSFNHLQGILMNQYQVERLSVTLKSDNEGMFTKILESKSNRLTYLQHLEFNIVALWPASPPFKWLFMQNQLR